MRAGGRKAQKRLRKAVRLGVEDEVDEEGSQQEEQKAKPKPKAKGKARAKGRPKAKPKQKAKGKAKAKGHSAASNSSESDGAGQLFETPERKEQSTTGLVPMTADEQSEDSGEKKMQAEDRLIKDEHSKIEGCRKRRTPKKRNVQRCLDSEMEDAAKDSCACS